MSKFSSHLSARSVLASTIASLAVFLASCANSRTAPDHEPSASAKAASRSENSIGTTPAPAAPIPTKLSEPPSAVGGQYVTSHASFECLTLGKFDQPEFLRSEFATLIRAPEREAILAGMAAEFPKRSDGFTEHPDLEATMQTLGAKRSMFRIEHAGIERLWKRLKELEAQELKLVQDPLAAETSVEEAVVSAQWFVCEIELLRYEAVSTSPHLSVRMEGGLEALAMNMRKLQANTSVRDAKRDPKFAAARERLYEGKAKQSSEFRLARDYMSFLMNRELYPTLEDMNEPESKEEFLVLSATYPEWSTKIMDAFHVETGTWALALREHALATLKLTPEEDRRHRSEWEAVEKQVIDFTTKRIGRIETIKNVLRRFKGERTAAMRTWVAQEWSQLRAAQEVRYTN